MSEESLRDYLERSSRTPARMSKTPVITMTPTSKLGCKMFSVSIVFVTTRMVRAKIMNPMNDVKPPRAIFKRCLPVKYGIALSHIIIPAVEK